MSKNCKIEFPEWVYRTLENNGNVYLPTGIAKNYSVASLERHFKNKLNMKVRVRIKAFEDTNANYKAYKQKRVFSKGFIAEIA